jgi:hypothetical protein
MSASLQTKDTHPLPSSCKKYRRFVKTAALAVSAMTYLQAGAVHAQESSDRRTPPEYPRLDTGPDNADSMSWDAEVSASALRSGFIADDQEFGGSGYIFGGQVAGEKSFDVSSLRIELESRYRTFDDSARNEQWRNRVAVRYRAEIINRLFLAAEGEFATNQAGVEAQSFDESNAVGSLEYRPGPHRLRLSGGWRWRDYNDGLGSKGNGPLAQVDYRYTISRKNSISLEARYEDISSDTARLSYERKTARAFYNQAIGDSTTLRLGSSVNWVDFDNRLIAGAGSDSRSDIIITPELNLLYQFTSGIYVRANTKYLIRDSNDPDNGLDSERLSFTLGYRF